MFDTAEIPDLNAAAPALNKDTSSRNISLNLSRYSRTLEMRIGDYRSWRRLHPTGTTCNRFSTGLTISRQV